MIKLYTFLRNIKYLLNHSLWNQREEDIVYLTNKILDDVQFEYDLTDDSFKPKILNGDDSLELVLSSGKSFVRTGDGEVKIMMGLDQPFQKYDKDLADGLKKILGTKNEKLLVGINRNYYIPGILHGFSSFYRRHAYDYRQYYKTVLNPDITYIDATLTSFKFGHHNDKTVIDRYEKWKNAFKNKNLVIICGEGILQKLDYDIFELAKSKNIIQAPAKNAWEMHKEIEKKIRDEVSKDFLIVFILGMAGKVMTSNLTEQGYTCWDVGHLAKYYDAFKKGIDNSEENIKKFYAPD